MAQATIPNWDQQTGSRQPAIRKAAKRASRNNKDQMWSENSQLGPIIAFTAAAVGWIWFGLEKRRNHLLQRKLREAEEARDLM